MEGGPDPKGSRWLWLGAPFVSQGYFTHSESEYTAPFPAG